LVIRAGGVRCRHDRQGRCYLSKGYLDDSMTRHASNPDRAREPAGLTRIEYGCFDQVAACTNPDGTRTGFGYDHALRLVRCANNA
jgi:YD repeat-containing protein